VLAEHHGVGEVDDQQPLRQRPVGLELVLRGEQTPP
jgi:hypothetical protein